MNTEKRNIIVIGASYGGQDTVRSILSSLPPEFPACIFVVIHGGHSPEGLAWSLQQQGNLKYKIAEAGEEIKPAHVYFAARNRHMILRQGEVRTIYGPMENRSRPAIDPLFRSAAVSYGPRVTGVVLTGYLNDGSSGLRAIRDCGGMTIAQDPKDAIIPEMPENAIRVVDPDFILPVAKIPGVLEQLVNQNVSPEFEVPDDLQVEMKAFERLGGDEKLLDTIGTRSTFSCPDCGGVLWETGQKKPVKYRCHLGHSYTEEFLLSGQDRKIDEMLISALRMFEERHSLFQKVHGESGSSTRQNRYSEMMRETENSIQVIREILKGRSLYHDGDES